MAYENHTIIKLDKNKEGEEIALNAAYMETFMYSESTLRIWIEEVIQFLKTEGHLAQNEDTTFMIQCIPLSLINLGENLSRVIRKINSLIEQGKFEEGKFDQYYEVFSKELTDQDINELTEIYSKTKYLDIRASFETNNILMSSFAPGSMSSNEKIYHDNPKNRNELLRKVSETLKFGSHSVYSGRSYIISKSFRLINILKGLFPDGSMLKKRIFSFDKDGMTKQEILEREIEIAAEADTYRNQMIAESGIFEEEYLNFRYVPIRDVDDIVNAIEYLMKGAEKKKQKNQEETGYQVLAEGYNQEKKVEKKETVFTNFQALVEECSQFVSIVINTYENNKETINVQKSEFLISVAGRPNIFVTNLVNLLSNLTFSNSGGEIKKYVKFLCLEILKVTNPTVHDNSNFRLFFETNETTRKFYSHISANYRVDFENLDLLYYKEKENYQSYVNRCEKYKQEFEFSDILISYLRAVFSNALNEKRAPAYNPEAYLFEGKNYRLNFSIDDLISIFSKVTDSNDDANLTFRQINASLVSMEKVKEETLESIAKELDRKYGEEVTIRAIDFPKLELSQISREMNWFSMKKSFDEYEMKVFLKSNLQSLSDVEYTFDILREDLKDFILDYKDGIFGSKNGRKHVIYGELDTIKILKLKKKIENYLVYSDPSNFQPIANNYMVKNKNIGFKMAFLLGGKSIIFRENGQLRKKDIDTMARKIDGNLIDLISEEKQFFSAYFANIFNFFGDVNVNFEIVSANSKGIALYDRKTREVKKEIMMYVNFNSSKQAYTCSKFFTKALTSNIDDISEFYGKSYSYYDVEEMFKMYFDKTSEQDNIISDSGKSTEKFYAISQGCEQQYPFTTKTFEARIPNIISDYTNWIYKTTASRSSVKSGNFSNVSENFESKNIFEKYVMSNVSSSREKWAEFTGRMKDSNRDTDRGDVIRNIYRNNNSAIDRNKRNERVRTPKSGKLESRKLESRKFESKNTPTSSRSVSSSNTSNRFSALSPYFGKEPKWNETSNKTERLDRDQEIKFKEFMTENGYTIYRKNKYNRRNKVEKRTNVPFSKRHFKGNYDNRSNSRNSSVKNFRSSTPVSMNSMKSPNSSINSPSGYFNRKTTVSRDLRNKETNNRKQSGRFTDNRKQNDNFTEDNLSELSGKTSNVSSAITVPVDFSKKIQDEDIEDMDF